MRWSINQISRVSLSAIAIIAMTVSFARDLAYALTPSAPITNAIGAEMGTKHVAYMDSWGGDCTGTGAACVVNTGNDSDIIGNSLKGYYHDTYFGGFQLDWNKVDPNLNVHVADSTEKCANGSYGYKFAGYAYSKLGGFVNFGYSNDIFVYYCVGDQKLHGYAYHQNVGTVSVEWIPVDITGGGIDTSEGAAAWLSVSADSFFVNSTTALMNKTSSTAVNSLQWDVTPAAIGDEVLFYVIK